MDLSVIALDRNVLPLFITVLRRDKNRNNVAVVFFDVRYVELSNLAITLDQDFLADIKVCWLAADNRCEILCATWFSTGVRKLDFAVLELLLGNLDYCAGILLRIDPCFNG